LRRIGRDTMQAKRDAKIENELQITLNTGANVWAIGDVHGDADTLELLIEKLNLDSLDRIVLLGDLVDRGPKSCKVIEIAKSNSQIFSVLGNHEDMMLANFDPVDFESPSIEQRTWMYNGGRATIESYINEFTDSNGILDRYGLKKRGAQDLAWLDSLPHHIVLDEFRLVHAGYAPHDQEPDMQSKDTLLWIRKDFHDTIFPIDNERTVIFGHSPMPMFGLKQSEVWESDAELANGRTAAIGIDSCCYGGKDPQLTAINLQTGEIIKQKVQQKKEVLV